ncbi:serine hydrolase domain-containing protein [Streptomyces roseolilacinus]|uniref:Serine hydrolase n=1 Tax=Streptomyces roseolilacinus TaxID=66904 RepID=A0A918EJW9_9ACTN|nr:serine hydrolase domain-containing protein [Streptomyces roseolilacinus]GGQ09300.1 serine hydrolase [Streptomyces roseolilacinus]
MAERRTAVRGGRRAVSRGVAAALAGATLLGAAPGAWAAPSPRPAVSREEVRSGRTDLDRGLAALVERGGSVAALAELREDHRVTWRGAAGLADLATGERTRPDGRARIGSVTKTFVATVTLQLAAEGRIRLDGPVEEYLPGAVRNGRNITVRQLLNHTSGLYDYWSAPEFALGDEASVRRYLREGRWKTYTPRELLDVAARHDPYFAPGRGWKYSNTNYVLVGMLIEKVSGRSWQQEVERRILRPLRLGGTVMPTTSPRIPGPHAKGYLPLPEGPADVSLLDPSVAGAAGGGISTTADLNRFLAALLGGRLLPKAQLAEMLEAVPAAELGASYGLGIIRYDTACGPVWGHPGGIPGYSTFLLGTQDGRRQFALSDTPYGDDATGGAVLEGLLNEALCGTGGGRAPVPASFTAPPRGLR